MTARTLHRWIGSVMAVFALWFAVSGIGVQLVDLVTLLRNPPATDPELMAIRESLDGPPNQAVIRVADYAASALPTHFDPATALARAIRSARVTAAAHQPLRYAELRQVDGRPVVYLALPGRVAGYSAETGRPVADEVQPANGGPRASVHHKLKQLHRLAFLGDLMLWLNALAGILIGVLTILGLRVYFQLLSARTRMGRRAPFWAAGGPWRRLHRGVSVVAAVFLLWIAATGVLLSFDSLAFGIYRAVHPERLVGGFAPHGMVSDYSSPLRDDALPGMLETTLRGFERSFGDQPVKVVRLRTFAGMPQGVVIAGGAGEARQLIFDARDGHRAGLSGPDYPFTGFPLGWELHEWVKKAHRGDAFGLPGRLLSLLSGLSLAFLAVSGMTVYVEQLRRRRAASRRRLFWS